MVDRRGYKRSPITIAEYRRGVAPPNKGRRLPAEPLSVAEVFALLDACELIGRRAGRRNRAMIVLFWRSGLRCAEVLALRPKDVDLERGRVAVLHGKGDRRRLVGLDPIACAELALWMVERQELGFGTGEPLFCVVEGPSKGLPINPPYVRELLKRLAYVAGITKRVHPHGLRHTYASYLLDQGVPLHVIRRMLGHSSLAITERYADHLNPFAALEEVRRVSWPDRNG
jgi:site-specific recombinase XerD